MSVPAVRQARRGAGVATGGARSVAVSPPLKAVRKRSRHLNKKGSHRITPLLVVATICAAAVIAGVVLEQVVLAQSAFKVVRLRDRTAAAEARHEELLLEAARLEAPGRIERVAREEIGMIDAPAPSYIVADIKVRSSFGLAQRSHGVELEDSMEESLAQGVSTGASP
ncbi:MAG: cell division protein FtsL [Actinomycetota bacterium]|nr:cell division protein FtsL [Actinomycetota bacterium]